MRSNGGVPDTSVPSSVAQAFEFGRSTAGPEQMGLTLVPVHCHVRVTERQVQILCLLAQGLTTRQAAESLMLSEHTVVRHMTNMMVAMGAANRLELLARALIGGLIANTNWPPQPTGRRSLPIALDITAR